jgi:HEAT repeat protein
MSRSMLAIALCLASSAALAAPTRTAVLEQLAGFESGPDVAALQALGEGADDTLRAIATDASLSETTRMQAVHALRAFPTDTNRTFLTNTLSGSESRLARKAAWALAQGWGNQALPELSVALKASDTQLRIATIEALGELGTTDADNALRGRLPDETNSTVVASINQALSR